jgi:hypothetical protein
MLAEEGELFVRAVMGMGGASLGETGRGPLRVQRNAGRC